MQVTESQLTAPQHFSEERSAEIVADSFAAAPDPRLREVLQSLIRHLHAFVKEVDLAQSELDTAIEFLTRTGHTCDPTRQEFVLLSDVLGVSMLVDTLTHRSSAGATESTVLGPFHLVSSPGRRLGESIAEVAGGDNVLISGRVLGVDGEPLAGAWVDVWQADGDGFYDVQRPDVVPEGHLRGQFDCDGDGAFHFVTVMPSPYPIPTDGPVGQLLAATGRSPWRPAHIHFLAGAPGHAPLTTHIFVSGSPYLDSDAVFGVKASLIVDFAEAPSGGPGSAQSSASRQGYVELRLHPL
jgi:catechol 1,2-dioxygenase